MHFLANFALWFLILVNLGRFQEIFPILAPLQLGKVSVAFGLIITLITNAKDLLLLIKDTSIKNYFIAILLISFLGIPFSVYPGDALNKYIVYLRILLSTSIIIALGRKNLESMRLCLIFTLLFLSVQMVLQKVGGRISVGGTYDPNDIAFLCVVFLPVAISGITHSNFIIKIFSLVASGGAVASIALSGSRGGFIALIAMAFYGIILAKKRRFLLIITCIAGGIIFSAMAGEELWARLQSLRDGTDYNFSTTGDSRLAIWTNALEIMLKRPIFGVGIGQFVTGIATLTGSPWKTAHNSFLQIGMELGVIGLYAFCAILLFIYRLSLQGQQSTYISTSMQTSYMLLRMSLIGYCVGAFFISHAYTPITYTFISLSVVMHLHLQQTNAKAILYTTQKQKEKKLPFQHDTPKNSSLVTAQKNQAKAKRDAKKSKLYAGDILRQKKKF